RSNHSIEPPRLLGLRLHRGVLDRCARPHRLREVSPVGALDHGDEDARIDHEVHDALLGWLRVHHPLHHPIEPVPVEAELAHRRTREGELADRPSEEEPEARTERQLHSATSTGWNALICACGCSALFIARVALHSGQSAGWSSVVITIVVFDGKRPPQSDVMSVLRFSRWMRWVLARTCSSSFALCCAAASSTAADD